MEGLTRLVAESLARHGFDRPLDYRRLHWSRWFRCESHHSLLFVPSRPGVFAIAEEIMNDGGAADPLVRPAEPSSPADQPSSAADQPFRVEGWPFRAASSPSPGTAALAAEPRRMLAVTQFFEADDMAFILDRMLSRPNPMQARLASGRYFVRFVVIEEASQRRTISSALNQWMISSAEKATGIGAQFSTSLELAPATEYIPQPDERQQSLFAVATGTHVAPDAFVRPSSTGSADAHVATAASAVPRSEASGSGPKLGFSAPVPAAPQLDSGAAANIHCPSPFPSGF
ncbi:MAG TPA: hypothetical protein VGS05_00335 [Candidatus Sulfotelmatobacter sp.]|nr:hypothetical protein [Candidatus Sulfotelmatobacter sp.]